MFQKWAQTIATSIRAESTVAGALIPHSGRRGSEREGLVRGALSRILPADVEVGTGHIFDSAGSMSKQIDVIVARRNFPVIRFSDGSANYLAEAVVATIEVKSNLDRAGLVQGIENCRSVTVLAQNCETSCFSDLERIHDISFDPAHRPQGDRVNVSKFLLASKPATYVLGYESAVDIWTPFSDWYKAQRQMCVWDIPSLIMSISESRDSANFNFIVRNDDGASASAKIPHALAGYHADPFELFIIHMLRTVFRALASPPTPTGFIFSARSHIRSATFGATQGIGDLTVF